MNELQAQQVIQQASDMYDLTPPYTGLFKGEQDIYIYGSPNRPMSGSWARIEGAYYVTADFRTHRVHTFIVVAHELDHATIQSYELTVEPMFHLTYKDKGEPGGDNSEGWYAYKNEQEAERQAKHSPALSPDLEEDFEAFVRENGTSKATRDMLDRLIAQQLGRLEQK
jgi:hypothetical protein